MDKQLKLLDLPSEILQKILSYVPTEDLFFRVGRVCKRFEAIATKPELWNTIVVENEVPTETLRMWIKSARRLKHFKARLRNDTNIIAEEVSKCSKQLESIQLLDCWGTSRNFFIHSNPLCNLVTRCPNLRTLNLSHSRFRSCKFFRLISGSTRGHGRVIKKYNYTGPITRKQLKAFFSDLTEHEVHDMATFGNANQDHQVKLKDIVRYISTEPNAIDEIWENMSLGVPPVQNNADNVDGQ